MNILKRIAWDILVIRILRADMKQFRADDLIWSNMALTRKLSRYTWHAMPTIIERHDSGHDNKSMHVSLDVAPQFSDMQFHNAIFYKERQIIEDLFDALAVLLVKESAERHMEIENVVTAYIDVLGKSMRIKMTFHQTEANSISRYQVQSLSWRSTLSGILVRAWMQVKAYTLACF